MGILNDVFAHFFFIEVRWTVIPNVKSWKFITMYEKIILLDFFSC